MTNWNRWGAQDEAGAANLLTPAHVLQALRSSAASGRVYPLAQALQMAGVPKSDTGVAVHLLARDGGDYATGAAEPVGGHQAVAMDYLFMRLHGTATHIDALGHVWSGDHLYNGHPSSSSTSAGLRRCGIDKLPGIVTRGVLLDLARAAGRDHLEPAHEVTVAELEKCAAGQGTELKAGDAVLMRTGWPAVYQTDPELYVWEFPGIGLSAARWLAAQDVVLVGADTLGVEVRTRARAWELPVHLCLLHEHGIYMLEMLDLERLAADAVHSFLFVAAPLPLTGGTGSPVNPLAIA